MGSSLPRYLQIKVHQAVLSKRYSEIIVHGAYNRSSPLSSPFDGEKRDKPFNWERPTARPGPPGSGTLYIECFPGYDHVEHYAEIIACYLRILESSSPNYALTPSASVSFVPSSCTDTLSALANRTNLPSFPGEGVHTVVLGMVWHLTNLTSYPTREFEGSGPWQWIIRTCGSGRRVAFLGFRPAFWGDIAGEVVHFLAERHRSIREFIYVGKLGVLRPEVRPNAWLATGGSSVVNGRTVEWDNVLAAAVERRAGECTIVGRHVTLGSVLHETKGWYEGMVGRGVDFVDPEIGNMAQAAVRSGTGFGYCHLITDNLGRKYEEDLSNEREERVVEARKRLYRVIGEVLEEHLGAPVDE
jgi:hypothetical protein